MRTQSLSCTWQAWSRASPCPAAHLPQEKVTTWAAPPAPAEEVQQHMEGVAPISSGEGCSVSNL